MITINGQIVNTESENSTHCSLAGAPHVRSVQTVNDETPQKITRIRDYVVYTFREMRLVTRLQNDRVIPRRIIFNTALCQRHHHMRLFN